MHGNRRVLDMHLRRWIEQHHSISLHLGEPMRPGTRIYEALMRDENKSYGIVVSRGMSFSLPCNRAAF